MGQGLRIGARRLAMGLATVTGLARRGFFIPYRYAGMLPAAGGAGPYPEIATILAAARGHYAAHLAAIDSFAADLSQIGEEPPPAPRWAQDWFPRLDAAAAYAMVRSRRPARIVEVGSGHSTRFICRAARDAGRDIAITAIDPAPRADLAGLPVTLVQKTVQEAGLTPFAGIAPGDMVMIDSSHIAMPGSDVDFLLSRVWPSLPDGVLVHIHDILLPDDYPAAWGWRGYNEQQAVAALIAGGAARILFASHYVVTRMATDVAQTVVATLPLNAGAHETGLWLEKGRT